MEKRAVLNRINDHREFEGSYEECLEYFNNNDNGHLDIITC